MQFHATPNDKEFVDAIFSIELINHTCQLVNLLSKIEKLETKVIAVDFEGER